MEVLFGTINDTQPARDGSRGFTKPGAVVLVERAELSSHSMSNPTWRRPLVLALIAAIMICCTASAVFGLRSGHTARAASTFFAGLTFSILFWTQLQRKKE